MRRIYNYKSLIYLISFAMFIYFLVQNFNVNYYDENGYIQVSQSILSQGLFNIAEPLRTYLYPLIISIISVFTDGNIQIIKIIVSVFQYTVYFGTIIYMSRKFSDSTVENTVLIFGLLNPYLIQSTTLFLTDLLATCAIIISLFNIIFGDFEKKRTYYISFFFIIIAVMIRPSSLIMLPLILLILIIRYLTLRDVKIARLLAAFLLSLLIFIPQLLNNIKQFNHWTPLIHQDLYDFQSRLAASYLKYGTVVMPNEEPGLIFKTPFIVGPEETIYGLILSNFIGFVIVYGAHLFGAIDWGYIDTYIRDWYPISRIVGSAFLYLYWILAFYGGGLFLVKREKSIKEWFAGVSLVVAFLGYWLFIGTTVVESRFGYPLFMMLLPFAGLGIKRILVIFLEGNRIAKIKVLLMFTVLILIMYFMSFVLDYQTGRINWFN